MAVPVNNGREESSARVVFFCSPVLIHCELLMSSLQLPRSLYDGSIYSARKGCVNSIILELPDV